MSKPRIGAVFLAAVVTLSACSSGKHLGAAEPATAPAQATAPTGTVRSVGALPEGIVYDPTTKLVAVAVRNPFRLQLLDPTTLAVRHSVALPGDVRHLQLAAAGGPVLVPDEAARRLLQISLPGGAITSSIAVGKQPHDAGRSGSDIVVGNEFGKSLSVIRNGRVIKTLGGVQQPGGIVGDGSTVAVVDVGKFTVSTYDLRALKQTAVKNAGKGPTHGVLISGNRVLVADTRGNAMLEFSVDPLKQIGRLPLTGAPYGMATDETTNTAWVTLTARNEVVGLDVSGTTPRVIARYRTVRQPNTVAVEPGSHTLWVTGTHDGVVQRITR